MLIEAIDSYLALRRAAGFQLRVVESLLHGFARFAARRGEMHVRAETAIEWASQVPTLYQRDRRLKTVIKFARHVRVEDKAHEMPPDAVFAHPRQRRRPYIFSPTEVRQLLEAARRLGPEGSLRPHTYTTLFGLLAACGLRISEALALQFDDVTADGLVICKTKFRKSRLVPLHKTTATALTGYIKQRLGFGGDQTHLFLSLRCRPLTYPTVVATFLSLVRELGIHPGAGLPGPRLHDLRHTFACRSLESCPVARTPDSPHILALSTYLGHAHVSSTAWYLHATPALMTGIADAYESLEKGGRP